MTIYRVKLHDKAASESRYTSVAAASEDEALYVCEQQEVGHVGFWLPASEAAELEAKEAEGSLSGREKGRLQSHRQSKAYQVVKAGEAES
jgi:hypothetical protein